MSGVGRVLRDPNCALYLSSVVVSGFGSGAMTLAAGVWVMELTGDSGLAALVTLLVWLPTLAGPLIGAAVGRAGRHLRLLVRVQLGMGALLLTLLAVGSVAQLWLLFAVMVVYGVTYVALSAAESAVLPAVVPAELLGHVNGLRLAAAEGTKLAAPLAGAGLFALVGGGVVAVLDAVTFAVAALLCGLIRPIRSTSGPVGPRGPVTLRGLPLLRGLVAVSAVAMFLAGVAGTMIFAMVDRGLRLEPTFVGVLSACQGAGSVIAGVASGALLRRCPPMAYAAGGVLVFALGVLLRTAEVVPLVVLGGVLAGLGLPAPLIATATVLQTAAAPAALARLTGTVQLATYAPSAVGQALGVVLVGLVDYRIPLAAMGLLGVLTAVVAARRGRSAPAGPPNGDPRSP
ncbi:hypothetical protein [Actinokineospora sp. NBRC 105648]|uniref:hypothetical protein n=1 Tax=Actinokineospora sp. NBRC 105648 TaxID=3032206 RepID=UPI0024A186E1|nr:hypothetical protein [Actinokineospora sp. NBRC 105648]GLZ39715.1 MFS transporter [Actinokineospora sp. NBRC 105648]